MVSQIVVLLILILVNAYFAASEMAFISLNDAKIDKQAREGNKKAKNIQKMLREPSKFLATIQIGITLAGFLSSAFASEAFAQRLAPVLNSWLPAISLSAWQTISIIIITILLSFVTLIFGELVPKRLAMKYYEKISYATIGVIRAISIITAPIVKFLTFCTNLVSKIFGVGPNEEEIVSEEEIRIMLDEGQEKGTIHEEEKEMINNIFEFNDIIASETMLHRTEIFAVDINDQIDEILKEIAECKYSRIPVYNDSIDNIVGILYIKDLFNILNSNGKINLKSKGILKEALYVSESTSINKVFKKMQKQNKQIAIVVDEYGGTAGLITIEDILEEIVGNIFDEYDEVEIEYEMIDDNTYLVNGDISIIELEKALDIVIPDGDYDALSGYLIDLMGGLPTQDEQIIETKDLTYKIEKYSNNKIEKVKVCKNYEIKDEIEE